MHYFSRFFKKVNETCVHFKHLDKKLELLGNLWEIFEDFQNLLKKITKIHYFSIFLKEFNKACVISFARLDEKLNVVGNFEKNLKVFAKNSIEKFNF